MEINGTTHHIAYFRESTHTDQCELLFNLETDLPGLGRLSEEFKSVRQRSDTVSSLLQHTQNKLVKYLQDIFSGDDNKMLIKDLDIPCSIVGDTKPIKTDTELRNLPAVFQRHDYVIFKIFDQSYVVTCNAPLVKVLELPPIFFVGFSVQPKKFHSIYTEKQQCIFKWYKSLDKIEWKEIGRGFTHILTETDLGHFIKVTCVPKNVCGLEGPLAECMSDVVVEKMGQLPSCPFESRHEFTKHRLSGRGFRVVSYNVLAERYTTIDENYNYCEPRYLSMDYRKQLIEKELLGYNADIICLQEVDNRHYTCYFKKQLKENGYYSFYHKKGNRIPEGLAIFFNNERFKQVEVKHMIFSADIESNNNYSHLLKLIKLNSTLRDDFLKQLTSLQVTVLKLRKSNRHVIIGNTHLYYHPDANHIRLLQTTMATSFLNYFKRKYSKMNADVSVIFCGDFNSSPKKSLLPFMLEGKLQPNHEDAMKINNSGKTKLSHPFHFESACGTPKYTNYTPDFKDCLDYIFIERKKMTVTQVVPFTAEEELQKYEGLPNEFFPSDHLALVVDLEFK